MTDKSNSSQSLWRPVGDALKAIDDADAGSPRRNILILGAGIAGLVAAWELTRRGHRVEILEATRDRVGGRLWTWRSDDGRFHGERAAMRIPSTHDYSLWYVRQAGLSGELRPFVNTEQFWAVGETVTRASAYSQDIYPRFAPRLNERERELAKDHPGPLLSAYMDAVMRSLTPARQRALLAGDFSDPVLVSMDRTSWLGYLRGAGASEGALDLLGRVLGIAAVWDWSLAALLRDGLHQQNAAYELIRGGFDQLPKRLYDRLKETQPDIVRFSQQVLDLDLTRRVVRVRHRETGAESERPFQQLLVTLPFPVMHAMRLNGFTSAKTQAIREIRYASACKDLLAYEDRFWERQGVLGGRSKTDGPNEDVLYFREAYYPMDRLPAQKAHAEIGLRFETEDGGELAGMFGLFLGAPVPASPRDTGPSSKSDLPGTLLGAYTLNEGARTLQRMSAEERREAVVGQLEAVHGPDAQKAIHYVPWSWDLYPWSRGALAITPPNDLHRHLAAAKQAERGVHFAGEHVSMAPGWIQGSLESCLREVEAMLRSPRLAEDSKGDDQ